MKKSEMDEIKNLLENLAGSAISKSKSLKDNYEEFSNSVRKIKSRINIMPEELKAIKRSIAADLIEETSVFEVKAFLDMLNYEGLIYFEEFYIDIVRNYLSANKRVIDSVREYIQFHNDECDEELLITPDIEFDELKEFLVKLIENNKFLHSSLNCKMMSLQEKITLAKSNNLNEYLEELDSEFQLLSGLLAKHSSVSDVTKLLNFIKSTSNISIKNKHIEIFKKMAFVDEDFINAFKQYAQMIEEKIMPKVVEKPSQLETKPIEKITAPEKVSITKKDNDEVVDFIEEDVEDSSIKEIDLSQESKLFFSNLMNGYDFSDIQLMLPKFPDANYFKIKNDLLYLLDKEIKTYVELLSEDPSLSEESDKLTQLFLEINFYFKKEENPEVKAEDPTKKCNLFFAERSFGEGSYLLDDLKEIELANLPYAEYLINLLNLGYKSFNQEKQKKLTNNKKIGKVFELKYKQVRLVYSHIKDDKFFVLGIYVKKSNYDKTIYDSIIGRLKYTKPNYESIKESFKLGITDENLTELHTNYLNEVIRATKINKERK